jgi:hypothetical protein
MCCIRVLGAKRYGLDRLPYGEYDLDVLIDPPTGRSLLLRRLLGLLMMSVEGGLLLLRLFLLSCLSSDLTRSSSSEVRFACRIMIAYKLSTRSITASGPLS